MVSSLKVLTEAYWDATFNGRKISASHPVSSHGCFRCSVPIFTPFGNRAGFAPKSKDLSLSFAALLWSKRAGAVTSGHLQGTKGIASFDGKNNETIEQLTPIEVKKIVDWKRSKDSADPGFWSVDRKVSKKIRQFSSAAGLSREVFASCEGEFGRQNLNNLRPTSRQISSFSVATIYSNKECSDIALALTLASSVTVIFLAQAQGYPKIVPNAHGCLCAGNFQQQPGRECLAKGHHNRFGHIMHDYVFHCARENLSWYCPRSFFSELCCEEQ